MKIILLILLPFLGIAQPAARIIKQPKGCDFVFVTNVSDLGGVFSIIPMCDIPHGDTVAVRVGVFNCSGEAKITVCHNFKSDAIKTFNYYSYFDVFFIGTLRKNAVSSVYFTLKPCRA